MNLRKCKECGEEHHAKGYCYKCYRKHIWKPKLGECKRCKRERPIHSKGYCKACYNFIFRLDYNKAWNHKKAHNIDIELYKKITKECVICDFDKFVDLHHLDKNKKNNSENNLVGMCPNHHRMIHSYQYKDEIEKILKEKGLLKVT